MKLSDFLVDEIYRLTKTDKVFGYVGGMVAHIVDSLYLHDKVEMVNMITEQGAGFAADGYARATGKVGVAIATSGPGATNLVTPIADCFFDSIPVLFITGQVNTYEYRQYNIRQCGFQETNIVDIVKNITKYAKTITDPQEIKRELHKAIAIASDGRKGPVLLDIPMDIQRSDIDVTQLPQYIDSPADKKFDFDFSLLTNASRPLILVGNGVNSSEAREELDILLKTTNIPIVESILGIDAVENDYAYNMGMIGTYGNRYGNFALYCSDLLLVLGARLDIRQTGGKTDFMNNKTIIHVDIDENELACSKFKKIAVHADVADFLKAANSHTMNIDITSWQDKCLKWKNTFTNAQKKYNLPNFVLDSVFDHLSSGDVISTDVGQNQMWACQSAKIKKNQRLLSSGGLGSMGFALPAGIGASISGKKVFIISGDGGFQMNIQELEVIKRRNLPVKIIIMNNKNLGMVRAFQELYFNSRCASTVVDYSAPDFIKIANAYGITAVEVEAQSFNSDTIQSLLYSNEPILINVLLEQQTEVEPRLQFGNSIENAHPLLSSEELSQQLG